MRGGKLEGVPLRGGTLDKLVQPAILAVLAEGPIHGYRLAERLGAMPGFAGHKPDASGVYRLLKAMEGRGLVVFSWDRRKPVPPREPTRSRPRASSAWTVGCRRLEEYRNRITSLLKTARNAAKQGD